MLMLLVHCNFLAYWTDKRAARPVIWNYCGFVVILHFPGLAISSAKILTYFSNKIYGSNFIKQHSETVMV